jgi:hypothetical protein
MAFDVLIDYSSIGATVSTSCDLTADAGTVSPTSLTKTQLLNGYVVTLNNHSATEIYVTPQSGGCPADTLTISGTIPTTPAP